MEKELKYRHELKYICSENQISVLAARLGALMTLDSHAKNGQYNIRSMYFDSYDNRCYFENQNGTNPREKYRIRIYNQNSDRINLECKQKSNGMTHKISCILSMQDYCSILSGSSIENLDQKPSLLRKLILLQHTQLFKPSVIVDYDRIPFVCSDGNVRITIDKNIRSSIDFTNFFDANLHTRPLQPQKQHLLEIKYDEFLPDYIKNVLQIGELQQTTFSKFFLCKKFQLEV